VDGSGRGCKRGLLECSRGSTGWGPNGVSQRKRDAVVHGESEYRSGRLDMHVHPDIRALAVPIKKPSKTQYYAHLIRHYKREP